MASPEARAQLLAVASDFSAGRAAPGVRAWVAAIVGRLSTFMSLTLTCRDCGCLHSPRRMIATTVLSGLFRPRRSRRATSVIRRGRLGGAGAGEVACRRLIM